MEIEEEDVSKLKQLDRIELRQRVVFEKLFTLIVFQFYLIVAFILTSQIPFYRFPLKIYIMVFVGGIIFPIFIFIHRFKKEMKKIISKYFEIKTKEKKK